MHFSAKNCIIDLSKTRQMNTIYRTCLVSLLFIFWMNRQGIAQKEQLRFEHIGVEEGLSNETVTTILQSREGFLWFGTFDGLFKYDGYSFTKYQLDPFDPTSLSQNFIYTIFEDRNGTIWTSSFEGLCKFDKDSEKFTRYKPSQSGKFSNPNITAINEDADGMLWLGSASGGLCRFNRKTGKFLPENFNLDYRQSPGGQAELYGEIRCIYKDQRGTLWVGNNSGLHKLNIIPTNAGEPSGVSFTSYRHIPGNINSLSSNVISAIIEDRAGIIWLATTNGLNSFDRKAGIFKHYQHDPENIHSISGNNLAPWYRSGIKEDKEGNLWICTNKGLNKLNRDRNIFTAYFHKPGDAYSLSSDTILSLEIDQAGILWAGTWGLTLNKANPGHKSFGLIRHDPTNVNSLSNNLVTTIVEDSSGIIWIGTYGGGLNRWDKKTDQFTHFRNIPSNPKTLRSDDIHSILEDRDGKLWVGNGAVLSRLNKETGQFTHYNSNAANFKEEFHKYILSIAEDHQGLLWLGTANGVKSFNKKKGEFDTHYYHNPRDSNGISDYTATTVFADSRDNIWIGYGSIATDKLNKRTGIFTHYKHNPQDSTSISSNIVNCFYEDLKGNLWMGTTSGGLCHFDYQKEKFLTFTDKDGLPGNTIYSIVEDNTNQLWLGTINGLSRFDPVTKTFTNYDYTDGLQGNVFAAGDRDKGAHFKGRDGTLYFGGNNGFNFFDPRQIKANSSVAPVVITQFKLFDKPVKGANNLKAIVFEHNQNYFSFEFSSLSFYNPAKNHYAYKLEGVDKDWIYSGTRRYVSYTNIDPGTYTFRVKGTNNDGVWNEKGTFISITINPPWWRTWWAYTLTVLLCAGFIYAVFRYRLNKIRIQHELELQQHKASQLEIESRQALLYERLRISRELHDDIGSTLGSISIYSEVARKRTEKNENADEVLFKIGLVSRELIDKMSDIVWSLNPDNESFEQLQDRIITFATMMLTPHNIKYDFDADERLKELHFTGEQRKNIFLIFKEALHNVVKYAGCKTVNISLCVKNNHLTMSIKDDGKGFDAVKTIVNNGPSNASPLGSIGGAGIKNMHARANAMDAKLSINSKINEGTSVQLTVNL
ncbi:MAG: signal transduction histidine kinase [Ferruginibacter sp.]|nr:signal transduction histidine kinase [Ferruginibacter sp.]